ncbi:MAG: hypothetical protein LBO62_08135 [Endomicrobium sp.]|jgi:hypothetical protein|nr:hypothetical protein [Endomicrobium sp.]
MKKFILIAALLSFAISPSFAGSYLFFVEAQGVFGYSFAQNKTVYHSSTTDDPMQKNSIGFDLIKKFSSQTRDVLTAALQLRIAYDDGKDEAQLQIYNAYLKTKFPFGDIWLGHNRAAFGLESYWDTHGALLQSMPMYGLGYDRDWGAGFSKDTENGNISFSFTSGTGMPLEFDGNWLISSRVSKGILNYDNYTAGLSFMGGNVYDIMGYEIMRGSLSDILLFSADFAYNYDNIEQKLQIDLGRKTKDEVYSALYRVTLNFLEENKLKLEGQGVYVQTRRINNYFLAAGASYLLNSDLTARIVYEYSHENGDGKVVGQLYYYFTI